MIRELGRQSRKNPFDTPHSRTTDSRWKELETLCDVGNARNLNRILFRRPSGRLDDMVPGMVSMFASNGSTIDSEVSPSISQVNSYDL